MAVTFPFDPPATPKPASQKLMPVNLVGVSRSPFTGKARSFAWVGGQLWRLDVNYPPMTRAQAAPWQAWALALQGTYGNFNFGDLAATAPRGIGTGTPLTNGVATAGSATLTTDGWTASQTGILKAGDYFQIGNDLHCVVQDANSDGSGNAVLTIWPFVRRAIADNSTIIVNSPKGLFKLEGDIVFDVDTALHYGFSFSATEDIQ